MKKRALLAVTIAVLGGVPCHAQVLEYGDTLIEIVGLETWSPAELEAAVQSYAPHLTLASAACAVILRDSVGFADAAVLGMTDQNTGRVSILLRVVEPEKRHLVQFGISSRRDIPPPSEWDNLIQQLEADRTAYTFLQFPEFLLDGATVVYGRSVPESAIELRAVLRSYDSQADWDQAARIISESSNSRARQVAALVLSNFASRDGTWHLLAEGMRVMSDFGGSSAQMIFETLARSEDYSVDWGPAEPALADLIGGTNLFAYGGVLTGLVQTGVDPQLARRLSRRNPELLAASAAANHRAAWGPARVFLDHSGAPDFGNDYERWLAWIVN